MSFGKKFPANYANSVQFTLQFCKTCEICTIYLCFRCLPRQRTLGNSSESSKICSIRSHTPQMMQNLHHLFTHLPYVSDACPSRELSEIPVNQAKFTPFAHKFRELHKLRAFCTKIHPHLVHYFQTSDHRQKTPENWSESTRFCAVRPQLQ